MTDLVSEETHTSHSLPHSLEAEQAVLGGLMLVNDRYDAVAEILSATDFFDPSHRLIFQAMAGVLEEGPLDILTLEDALQRSGELERVGGLAYLGEIAGSTPSAANILNYAQAVKERATLRQLIRAAGDISTLSFSPDGLNVDQLLELSEKKIQQIAEGRPKDGGFVDANHLLKLSLEKLEERNQSDGGLTGVATGFDTLDQKTFGWQPADLVILAARPSMGKTALAMNFVEHAVLNQERPVLVFSMEMPADSLMMRMLTSVGRIDGERMRSGQLSEDDWNRLSVAMRKLKDRPLYIDDTAALTPQEMRARVKRMVAEHRSRLKNAAQQEGLKRSPEELDKASRPALIMVDYLQLMQIAGASEGRTQEISEISRSLKGIAKEYGAPLIALSQLSRAVEQRPNKRPMNSDLRESGAIEQDADLIVFIYRDEYYTEDSPEKGIAEVIIGKHRNGETGTCRLAFIGKHARFDNLAPEYIHQD